jgi:LmbE family N-acetylglucosaminyl deacetylase
MIFEGPVLVVSAHADDEAFGMGGTIAAMRAQGLSVHWLIVTKLTEPAVNSMKIKKRAHEIEMVGQYFDFATTTQWDFPDNRLDTIALEDVQRKLIQFLEQVRPATIFSPSPWDFNHEHELVFRALESSTKPGYSPFLKQFYCYEIPSSTDWSLCARGRFSPNLYVDVSSTWEDKLKAVRLYEDEMYEYPHSRSIQYLEALATVRGAESGTLKAESFCLMRARQ